MSDFFGTKEAVVESVDDLLQHLKYGSQLTMTIQHLKFGDCFALTVTEGSSDDIVKIWEGWSCSPARPLT